MMTKGFGGVMRGGELINSPACLIRSKACSLLPAGREGMIGGKKDSRKVGLAKTFRFGTV